MKFTIIIILKKYHITLIFKRNNCNAQKPKLIPKIKCNILLYIICIIILDPKKPKGGRRNVLSPSIEFFNG